MDHRVRSVNNDGFDIKLNMLTRLEIKDCYDYRAENFLGFVRLASIVILLRCYL
jgi:hypothetical protein